MSDDPRFGYKGAVRHATEGNIVIAGFVLRQNGADGPSTSNKIILRGIGPSLAPGTFPASAVLADPTLELRDTNGTLILANNDWQDNAVQAAEIAPSGLAPSNNLESAIAATLSPAWSKSTTRVMGRSR